VIELGEGMSSLDYFEAVMPILEQAMESQAGIIRRVAERMADVIASGNLVYVFGAGHAGILAEELSYRAGGLVPIVPILAPGLTLGVRPMTLETKMERLSGYAALLLDECGIAASDLLIVHSNSGRNTVAIELAEGARERGIMVVALTSVAHSKNVTSRHPKGYKLMDVADYVIDNCGVAGDAAVELPGVPQKTGATSTVVGAVLLNAAVVESVRILLERGIEPPIFRSANLDGSDEHNQRLMDRYSGRLTYL
jgi:uncharacterized phosphosugar-binding protein